MDHNILPSPDEFRCVTDLQVRFNDIDILGHVNNTIYFQFYDTAKAEYMGKVKEGKINWRKVETVIVNVDCAFIHSIYYGEEIAVYTRCSSISEKSFRLLQMIVNRTSGEVKSVCESVMVCFNPETHEATEVPDHWRRDLCRYEGRDLQK